MVTGIIGFVAGVIFGTATSLFVCRELRPSTHDLSILSLLRRNRELHAEVRAMRSYNRELAETVSELRKDIPEIL